jgi:hypothetical protein
MTFTGLPALSKTGLYEAWIQISGPALADALELVGEELAAVQAAPELAIFAGLAVVALDEHAVVAALDLAERVAQGLQEVSRWR